MNREKFVIMLYFLSLALFGVLEIVLQRKSQNWKLVNRDMSFILFIISFYISVYLSPLEYVIFKPMMLTIKVIIGFLMLYSAIIIRVFGLMALGENFSVAIESKTDSRLIVSGIYKYVRHPLYLAVLLMSISGSIIFSCYIMWFFVITTLTGILIRINKEEIFLLSRYEEYSEYSKRTKKLLPFIY